MRSRPTTELGAAKPPIERVAARPGTAQPAAKPPIELKVEYKRLNSFFADYAKNISRGGTFIKTSRPLPIGTEFVFRLRVPVLDTQLFIHGEVKRIIADNEVNETDPEPGMSIRFVYRIGNSKLDIESTVEKLMVDTFGAKLSQRLLERARVGG